MSKAIIPKFGSFKPKTIAEDVTPPREERKRESVDAHHQYRSHRESHQKEDKYSCHERKRHRRERKESPEPRQIVDSTPESSTLYVVDKRGDPQNLVYGSLHSYSVPNFRRIGAGRVLGAQKNLRIDRETFVDGKGVVLAQRDRNVGHREKYVFGRIERSGLRLLRVVPESQPSNSQADFIQLKSKKTRKKTESDSEEDAFELRDHYRSIEGKAKASSRLADEDLEYLSDSNSSGPDSERRQLKYDDDLKQKTIALARGIENNPGDVNAWLALINHQDVLLGQSREGRRKVTAAERRSTADIKIHLYEKAIDKAGSDLNVKETLLVGLMVEGAKFWDYKTQSERWQSIASQHVESLELWRHYVDFQQSNFNAFRFETTRDIYVDRIRLLKSIIKGEKRSNIDRGVAQEHLIYTILRATLFMREAGFSELAVAIWQGLLEVNFMDSTETPSGEVLQTLEQFQEFWESEVARIGEDGARGWSHYQMSSDGIETPVAETDEETQSDSISLTDLFQDWLVEESARSTASRKPARTTDEVFEDDPYRVILWSDIDAYLFNFNASPTCPATKELLLDAFLMFCRLQPSSASQTSRRWWAEAFIRGNLLDSDRSKLNGLLSKPADVTDAEVEPQAKEASHIGPLTLTCFVPSPDLVFQASIPQQYIVSWTQQYGGQESEGPVKYQWVRNCMRLLSSRKHAKSLREYWLAFEMQNEPETIKKNAKSLLKQNPTDMRLYNAYALIESARGNSVVALTVIKAALEMGNSLPENENDASILLERTRIWLLIDAGEFAKAYQYLLSISDGLSDTAVVIDILSPSLRLKSNYYLKSKLEAFQISGQDQYAAICLEMIALMAYLSPNDQYHDIEAALKTYTTFSETIVSRGTKNASSLQHELLQQSAAHLTQFHITRNRSYRPALVREYLTTALSHFPQNTILLSVYALNERRLRIDDRVRSQLLSNTLTPENDCLTSRIFAIQYELRAGNAHSVNAAFENAVGSHTCASNPGLWRFFVLFCISREEYRNRAKDVFYRGMRACSWSKAYLMLAFKELRELMSFSELRSIYKLLGEKELRIHVDLEDKLEEWDEARKPRVRGYRE